MTKPAWDVVRAGTEAQCMGCETKMLGASEPMLRVHDQIRRAAASNSSVVISGESGTGKELVANALHALSPRSQGPFIDVNTAAVPQNLIESELFGHVRGAFTGATGDRVGCFEAAHGGTLFIDEVGELELSSQTKLLRTLETKRVRRVGACDDRVVDTRVIAATHRELEVLIEEGTFRQDLYFRLSVMTIHLPPLRDRASDISLLIDHYLALLCERMNRPLPKLDPALVTFLLSHDWPGNVRQLKNCLESMLVMSSSDCLSLNDLPRRVFFLGKRGSKLRIPHGMTLAQLERMAIEQALAHTNEDRRQAAHSLGISVRTLQRKLKQWRAKPPRGQRQGAAEASLL